MLAHTSSSSHTSEERSSKFKEHLSIYVPPAHFPIELSRFSPESPPAPPSRTISTWTNTATMRSSSPAHLEANGGSPRSSRRFRDRCTKLVFDARTLVRTREAELVPIQRAELPTWSIEKRACCQHCPGHRKKKHHKRNRILIIVLIIVIIYLLGNTVFLNVRVLRTPVSVAPAPTTPSTSSALSPNAQSCLSQYVVNAPSNPSVYPCATCLPTLQAVPSNFSDGNDQDAQQIQDAIQFCGLRSIFENADNTGQTGLGTGGWVKDLKFCAWNGVSCDGSGRIASISLTFPGVPASLPNQIGALTGLQTLQVVGNSVIPAGGFPSSFASLTSLSTLHLESTAITAFPDDIFTSLNKMGTLTLVKNTQMGNNLPSSLSSVSLQNLIVNGQTLNNPLSALSSSSSLQSSLKLLDLSSTSISGIIPTTISSFASLVELHLDFNDLSTPLPSTFPPKLQSLSLSNNTGLVGSVSGSFCTLASLQNCNMRGTGLSAAGGCGVCQFT